MHRPQRFNAKARSSVAGGSHKKGKAKKTHSEGPPPVEENADTNADILEHKAEEDRERDRRERLKRELLEQSQSKASSKKRKRLDKYIDKKLKKEERLELFEKLAKSQAELPSTLQLQSSSALGTGKPQTHQDRLDKSEDKDVRRAMGHTQPPGKHRKRNVGFTGVAGDSDSEEDFALNEYSMSRMVVDDFPDMKEGSSKERPVVIVDSTITAPAAEQAAQPSTTVGSALQRNADGSVVTPRILKRKEKGRKTIFQKWKRGPIATKGNEPDEQSDSSFDSSDSAFDSADDEDEAKAPQAGDDATSDDDGTGAENEEGSGSEDSDEEGDEEEPSSPPKPRLAFKDWAMSQLSAVKSYVAPVPTSETFTSLDTLPVDSSSIPPKKKRKLNPSEPKEMHGPLGETLQLPSTSLAQHLQATGKNKDDESHQMRKVVEVKRPADVEEARLLLPIVAEEQPIMEAIILNPVVVICGETGSGKTTQVPQFLYEAGFGSPDSENPGMIGITQPRRVAAISMATRVAHELSLTSSKVSYQIRYDATVSPSTSIKFMTDGVLLRELATDFLLTKYSVLIIDEAHERSMNTDILIGVLSRVIKLREEMWKEGKEGIKPLRLVIMSATLRVSDFAENKTLFPSPPPVINVSARQHPVTIHFNRRTAPDYVSEAIRKTAKIHARLPPGGILIFLTGQNEITGVCRKLEARYGAKALAEKKQRRKAVAARSNAQNFFRDAGDKQLTVKPAQADVEPEDMELGSEEQQDLAADVDTGLVAEDDLEALDTDDEEAEEQSLGIDTEESEDPMHIVPLYSLLPNEKQLKVFEPPPSGSRLVVVATNVAETSLTIPGIRYVVDCGRAKERRYNVANGIQAFQVGWVSKASAAQRAGRAGRTGPGHCYRLYSSAVFENYFDQFSQPEILRMPIEGVVLQMKSMHIDAVVNFPFPTPPDRLALKQAETVLTRLGALEASSTSTSTNTGILPGTVGGKITELGRTMSLFPLSPRFSKMLVSGRQHGCLPYVVAIVSALSVGDPFLREEVLDGNDSDASDSDEELAHITSEQVRAKEARKLQRRAFFRSQQVHAALGNGMSDMFKILSVVGAYEYAGGGQNFCREHFVRPKAMEEIHKLRAQISSIVQTNFSGVDAAFVPNLAPPSSLQLKILRQLLTAGLIDQVAVRKDLVKKETATGDQHSTTRGVPYQAMGIAEDVYIHPSSVLAKSSPPEFIVFHEVVRTSKIWLKGCTVINPAWLSSLGKPALCTFSKPVKNSAGEMMVIPKFGPDAWELPPIKQTVS